MERHRIAVDQAPHGGSDYPFAGRDDASPLVLDLYLSYPDDAQEFAYPFRLAWLYGAGTQPSSPPGGMPSPAHDYDLVVVDADDAVVFDSTESDGFATTDWGDRRRVVEWRSGEAVCRLVYDHTVEDDFDEDTVPDPGVLDARTHNRLPRRLRSITVNDQALTGTVKLQRGYNVDLVREEPRRVDGGRFRDVFTLACAPGLGEGRRPGCEEEVTALRSVNGQTADGAGNLFVDFDACMRAQLVTTDGEYGGSGLDAGEAVAALFVDDDCQPCCPCEFYVRTYEGLRRMHGRWLTATQELESIRDQYHVNRSRWLAQRECRINNALRVSAVAESGCTLAMALSYCNTTFGCVHPVEVRVGFTLYEDGVEISPPSTAYICTQAYINDSSRVAEEPFTFAGTWPSFLATFPYLSPQESGTLRFRLCLTDCTDAMSVALTVSVHSPDPDEVYGEEIDLPYLDDGSPYGSAYPTRAVVELVRPLL